MFWVCAVAWLRLLLGAGTSSSASVAGCVGGLPEHGDELAIGQRGQRRLDVRPRHRPVPGPLGQYRRELRGDLGRPVGGRQLVPRQPELLGQAAELGVLRRVEVRRLQLDVSTDGGAGGGQLGGERRPVDRCSRRALRPARRSAPGNRFATA